MKQSKAVIGAALAAAGMGWLGVAALRRARQDDIQGEVAVVTGGSRGLGFLIARELGRNGCQVAICARNEQALATARAILQREGIDLFTVRCDVTDQTAVEQMMAEVTHHYGRVDMVVNNAGIIQVGPAENMTDEDFRRAMDTIFWGTYYATQAVLPQMLARGSGRITNITSIGGVISVPHLLPYSTAKFAATGFSQGLSAELRAKGIYVTTITPSTMRTGSHLQALFSGQQTKEYTWFGLSATLPIVSTSAEQAAREVVDAIKRRAVMHPIGWPAPWVARLNGLFPGLVAEILALVAYFMPDPSAISYVAASTRGMEIAEKIEPTQRRWLDLLMVLGQQAARRYHQYSGENRTANAPRNRSNGPKL